MQSLAASTLSSHSYTDLNTLQQITARSRQDREAALTDVARQFESMFLSMMIKSMRDASAVFAEGNFLNSNETEFRQDMLDNQLSVSLANGQGIGLAASLVRQLGEQYFPDDESSSKALQQDLWGRVVNKREAVPSGTDPVQSAAEQDLAPGEELDFSSPLNFLKSLLPMAKQAAERLGVDPRVLLAQSALETGWGKSVISDARGRSSNNLFNIKSGKQWDGDSVQVNTLEFRDGVMRKERASFRSYESVTESFNDYADFLQRNPRYSDALASAGDSQEYISALHDAGYATDPEYRDKVMAVFTSDVMQEIEL
jgi:flagellar protein FlgJ